MPLLTAVSDPGFSTFSPRTPEWGGQEDLNTIARACLPAGPSFLRMPITYLGTPVAFLGTPMTFLGMPVIFLGQAVMGSCFSPALPAPARPCLELRVNEERTPLLDVIPDNGVLIAGGGSLPLATTVAEPFTCSA